MAANNATELTLGLLAALPLVESVYQPVLSRKTETELKTAIILLLICAATYLITIGLLFLRGKQTGEPLWLFRRVRREKGTYIITNTIVIWTPAALMFSILNAFALFLRLRVSQGEMSYRNFLLLILIGQIPTGTAAILLTSALLFSAISMLASMKGRSRFDLPRPWLFNLIQFGLPVICLATILTVAIIGNNEFNKLVDNAGLYVKLVPQLAASIPGPADFTPELLQAAALFQVLTDLGVRVTIYAKAGVGIFCVWCFGYIAAFVPAGTMLSIELLSAIRTAQSQATGVEASKAGKSAFSRLRSKSERKHSALIAKHRLLITFLVFAALWAISDLIFGLFIIVNFDKSAKMSNDKAFHLQFMNMTWAAICFNIVTAAALFVRTLQGHGGTTVTESSSGTSAPPAFAITTHTQTVVDEDYADSKSVLPIQMNNLSTSRKELYEDTLENERKTVSHLVKFENRMDRV